MIGKAFISILFLAGCLCQALLAASQIVPDPEDIYQAFDDGFIEFEDYRRLLELSRLDNFTPEDSLYLANFPDLLVGFSSSPLMDRPDATPPPQSDLSQLPKPPATDYQAKMLFRQSNRINVEAEHKNLYRLNFKRAGFQIEGERELFYSGTKRWGKRSITYDFPDSTNGSTQIVAGNYSARYSMGLIYGYHGQVLEKESERDETEKLLYPIYGGSNGLMVTLPMGKSKAMLVHDVDQNATHRKQFTALSIPADIGMLNLRINAGFGRFIRRATGVSKRYSLFSIGGKTGVSKRQLEMEGAVAEVKNKFHLAGSARLNYRRKSSSINILAWSYASEFPSYFSGGLSSRRYISVTIDDLDLTVRDRFRGESGGAIKSSLAISNRVSLRTAFGYSWRNLEDNRIEYKFGINADAGHSYRIKLDCYRRLDNIYSSEKRQTRIQTQLSKRGDIGGRVVAGYRFERHTGRNDYFWLTEARVNDRWGRLTVYAKVDRLELSDLNNRYLYLSLSHDSSLGYNLRGYLKYSYRYRKDSPESSYGTLRWEIVWNLN